MERNAQFDAWTAGDAYDRYMGRWSGLIAEAFLDWLGAPGDLDWLDVGCGTGQLSRAILDNAAPASVTGIDPSEGFVACARDRTRNARATFTVADAQALPFPEETFDAVTSGLVLNFVPDGASALREMRRVLRPGGRLSFYVWDYPGGGMGLIDLFWETAARLDPAAAELDEARRFPVCTPAALRALCDSAGCAGTEIVAIERSCDFADFEDFWTPFTLGAGPAPGYAKSLPADRQEALRAALLSRVGEAPFSLPARVWAVRLPSARA